MKRLTLIMLTGLGAGMLVGCQSPVATHSPGGAALSVLPVVEGPSKDARQLLVKLEPFGYVQADIQHTVLQLFRVVGSDATPVLSGSQPVQKRIDDLETGRVNFHGLHPHTTYRVKAFAYDASERLISQDSAFVDIAVAASERPVFGTLTIALADKPFNGQATSSFDVRDGAVFNTSNPVALAFE